LKDSPRPLWVRTTKHAAHYLGAEAIIPALATGADVVLTGRGTAPSLVLAPLADRLGWEWVSPEVAPMTAISASRKHQCPVGRV
jgi:hypothetical protein